jgi:DNA-binding MarR family transcriptional regulator
MSSAPRSSTPPAPATGARLLHDLVATADLLLRESQRLFRPHGLSAAQFNVLNLLGAAPEGAGYSQRELADLLVVDRSNVTGLLDRMEVAGWVRRADDPADRRVYRVQLTPAGRRLWQKVAPGYADVVGQVTSGLGAAEMERGLALLARVREGAVSWKSPRGA